MGFVNLSFDHYYDYVELTSALEDMVEKVSELANLVSIGKSPKGRDLWLVELTNKKTGDPSSKPAVFIDGNTHAGEVTGSMVCLKTVYYLLSKYGFDKDISKLLDDVTFYVLPRIDPDGADFFLNNPYYVFPNETGGGRWYPLSEEEWRTTKRGLYLEDVNGDGYITQMRVPDISGDWKVSIHDKRLMVKREPGDVEGFFYRVYPEGFLLNYGEEKIVKMAPQRYSMNLNRNYPDDWAQEDPNRGSGPYPLSEPETRAVADFIISHPNICLAVTYHTHGGVLFSYSNDERISPEERNLFSIIESIFTKTTGYPAHTLVSHARDLRRGTGSTYLSLYQGVPTVTVEVWDPIGQATSLNFIERGGFDASKGLSREKQQLAFLSWNDKKLRGEGFINWHDFNHPQLGKIELGGWKSKFVIRNPPDQYLEEEIEKIIHFPLELGKLLPKLFVEKLVAIKLTEKIYRIDLIIKNAGALSTHIMNNSLLNKEIKSSKVLINHDKNVKILRGNKIVEFELQGYLYRTLNKLNERKMIGDKHLKTISWIIEAKKGSEIFIKIVSKAAKREYNLTI